MFDNVAYGLMGSSFEGVSEETKAKLVQEACKAAYAHDDIEQLP